MTRARRPLLTLCALLALGAGPAVPALAQAPPAATPQPQPPAVAANGEATGEGTSEATRRAAERERHLKELKDLEAAAATAAQARQRSEADIAALKQDRAKLNEALVSTGAKVSEAEERAASAESKLLTLRGTQDAIRQSLKNREAILVEVLAALQRLGRRPPPAVLARPEDMLQAVRTAILLGAVLPDLKAEAEALAGDLAELARLGDAATRERETIAAELKRLAEDKISLNALIEARRQRIAEAETSAAPERAEADKLAGKAKDLRELVEGLDREIASASRAAEDARRKLEAQGKEARERFAAGAFRDPARLAPKVAFAETRGLLPLPIAGSTLTPFGAPDGLGGTTRGVSLAARTGGLVSSPADAWVTFAGPFRSFGRMVILNAGGGYFVLLAGLERIDVELGQFVLAGEPVGIMGESAASPQGRLDGDRRSSVLYVEFRKDGAPIDPGPWWAKQPQSRQGGERRT